MDDGTRSGLLLDALSVLRLSPGILFFFVLVLLFTKPSKPQPPPSPSPITAVVVAFTHPRRALINILLLFIALTYILDGLIVFILAATSPEGSYSQWRGVELADVLGFVVFFSLAVIGTIKDKHAVDFWTRKRIKFFVIVALMLDIAYLVLLVLSVRIFERESRNLLIHLHINLCCLPLSLIRPLLIGHRSSRFSRCPRATQRPRHLLAQFPPLPRTRRADLGAHCLVHRPIQAGHALLNYDSIRRRGAWPLHRCHAVYEPPYCAGRCHASASSTGVRHF